MAKLTKQQTSKMREVNQVLSQHILSEKDKAFVLRHFHEGATNNVSAAGAFFTPFELALEFAEYCSLPFVKNRPTRILDLCAGIGSLSYALQLGFNRSNFDERCEITCVEINADYVDIGKKLLPDANWVNASVTDIDTILALGEFDLVISNPPFGNIPTFKHRDKIAYTGSNAIYAVIEIASLLANTATMIMPQQEAGFRYSGENSFTDIANEKLSDFTDQTGIELGPNNFSGTHLYEQDWKAKVPRVEFVECDFCGSKVTEIHHQSSLKQADLFDF